MNSWEYSERILRAASLAELQKDAACCARILGFEKFCCFVTMPKPADALKTEHFQFHNHNEQIWHVLYPDWEDEQKRSEDVRVRHARAGLPATAWSVTTGVGYTSKEFTGSARAMLAKTHDVGLRGGISVPMLSPKSSWALVTFSTENTSSLRALRPLVAPAMYFSSCLSAAVRRLHQASIPDPGLSDREREVLRWTAIGKTSWEVSQILALSEHTVNYHLQRAAKKLHVNGRQAACARALSLDLLVL